MPTVLEDVAFGPLNLGLSQEEAIKRAMNALDMVGMSYAANKSPHQLSFGERKRVAIATVLAMEPKVLVLDEPTANLDPKVPSPTPFPCSANLRSRKLSQPTTLTLLCFFATKPS